jgi:hypothetical protein
MEAKDKIGKASMQKEAKEFLLDIADYMLNREV